MTKKPKADKYAGKIIQVSLPGRPGGKSMRAAEAVTFARQLMLQQQWPVVAVLMQQVTEQVPAYLDAWLLQFDALNRIGDFPALARAATRCLNVKPRTVPALTALATALRMGQRHREALALVEKAVKLEPGNARVLNHLGIVRKELGELDEALAVFNRCIALQPVYCEPYWNRSDLLHDPGVEDIAAMEAQLARPELGLADQARLYYALARAHEYRGESEQQFRHIEAGAAAKRSCIEYDHDAEISRTLSIPDYFSPSLLHSVDNGADLSRGQQALSHPPMTPVFICGLPRSGTTLAEQILSSHPRVVAGDELTDLLVATGEVLREHKISGPFPEWAAQLQAEGWQQIGERYRALTAPLTESLRDGSGQPGFFTDKNLMNYKAIGLIHLALPEAKIIYCRRDPMDNLWGCYRQLFGDGLYFTYSQRELADTWHAASQLLAYWEQQLAGKLFILDYEALVADQEQVTRQLLDFVGLPWDDACLAFHTNPRAVRTTSATQVRSPLSSDRLGQWRPFSEQLREMQDRLSELASARDDSCE